MYNWLFYVTQKFGVFWLKKAICGFYYMRGFTWDVAILP